MQDKSFFSDTHLEHVRYMWIGRQDQLCFCKQITRPAHFPMLDTMCYKTREEPNQSHPGQLDSEELVPLRWSCLTQPCERTQKRKQNGWKGSASQQRVTSWRVSKSEAAVITVCRSLQQGGNVWTTSRTWQQLSAFSRRGCVLTPSSMHSELPILTCPFQGSWAGVPSQGCTEAQDLKGGRTSEKFEECCLGAVKSSRLGPKDSYP